MAGPIKYIRKNQKAFLAVLTVLTVLSFVFMPIVIQLTGGRGEGGAAIVVKTKLYGDLREVDLAELRANQQALRRLFENLNVRLARAGGQRLGVGNLGTDETSAVNLWLLANHARRQGLKVPDEDINNFLKMIAQQKVSHADVAAAIREAGMTQEQFFEAMRRKMLAEACQQFFVGSIAGLPAERRWEYYTRVNRAARIHYVSFPVASCVGDEQPPKETLTKFFEEHKNKLPDPNSPQPGFRQPKRADLEYVFANTVEIAKLMPVSDEEIKDYYEKHKEQFVKLKPPATPELPKPDAPKPDAGKPDAAKPDAGKPEAPKPEAPKSGDSKLDAPRPDAPKPETPKAETPKPERPGAAPPAPDAARPSDAPKVPEPKPEGPAKTSQRAPSRFLLTSFAEESGGKGEAAGAAVPPGGDKAPAAAAAAKTEAPQPHQAKAEPAKGEPAPSAKPEAAAGAAPAEQTAKPNGAASPAGAAKSEPPLPAPTSAPAPRAEDSAYLSLAEARESIRQTLAGEKANKKIEEVFKNVRAEVETYRTRLAEHEGLAAERKDSTPAPKAPDLKALIAGQPGFGIRRTGLVSEEEALYEGAEEAPAPGAERVDRAAARALAQTLVSPARLGAPQVPAVRKGLRMSRLTPETSFSPRAPLQCLFWKVGEQDEKVPEYDEVAAEVLKKWRLIPARDRARSSAEAVAKKAAATKQTLDAYARSNGLTLLTPPKFTWLTLERDWDPQRGLVYWARPSAVGRIDAVGDDFMARVFSLEPGQLGVATNHPQNAFYVIELADYEPSLPTLWQKFASTAGSEEGNRELLAVWRYDMTRQQSAFLKHVEQSAGLQWQRPPQVIRDQEQ